MGKDRLLAQDNKSFFWTSSTQNVGKLAASTARIPNMDNPIMFPDPQQQQCRSDKAPKTRSSDFTMFFFRSPPLWLRLLHQWLVLQLLGMSSGVYAQQQQNETVQVQPPQQQQQQQQNYKCFESREDLKYAILGDFRNPNSRLSQEYGYPIGTWCVDRVTDFSGDPMEDGYLFDEDPNFNEPLDGWNTSSVTDMSGMFYGLHSFNQPLFFDTSKVQNMNLMFYKASSFNQPLSNFDTSSVTMMASMFYKASSFNQPLDSFDTSKVKSMIGMFNEASAFNQPLDSFDTSKVESMVAMFEAASSFNQPLSLNASNLKDMEDMFKGASSFNEPLTLYDSSRVTNMFGMFDGASSFNQPLSSFDTSSVTGMSNMFMNAASFDQPLDSFDISSVTIMLNMFHGASSFRQSLCPLFLDHSGSVITIDMFQKTSCPVKDNPSLSVPLHKTSFCQPCQSLCYDQNYTCSAGSSIWSLGTLMVLAVSTCVSIYFWGA